MLGHKRGVLCWCGKVHRYVPPFKGKHFSEETKEVFRQQKRGVATLDSTQKGWKNG